MDCVKRDMRGIWTRKDEGHDRTGWRRFLNKSGINESAGNIGIKIQLGLRNIYLTFESYNIASCY